MVNNYKKVKWLMFAAASLILLLSGCTNDSLPNLFSDLVEPSDVSVYQSDYLELPKHEKMTVDLVKHVDGDTTIFSLNQQSVKVRYLLIDTPETVKQGTEPQPFGKEASERTKQLLTEAEKIEIMLDEGEPSDKYDRLLAYVFVDDQLVQDILIREGVARVAYITAPSTKYLQLLQESQEQAKTAGLGIWSIEDYVTENGFKD